MRNAKHFASCLKKAINTKAAYAALDSGSGGTWTAGGCWTLAHAVAALTGGELWALTTGDRDARLVQHVVVKTGRDQYLDGDGLSTLDQLLVRWREEMHSPEWARTLHLEPLTEELQRASAGPDLVCDTRVATALLPALTKCARRR